MMATLLFIIPSGKDDGEKLMDWGKCRKLQWHIILLLGAGFAIADGFKASGLTDILSSGLGFLKGAPALAIAPVACLFSGLITEFTSDDATTTLVLPLLAELGKSIGVHPLLLMVPGAIGAQLSFLLPTGSPGNVVGFGTGYITIKDMVLTGMPLKVVGVASLTILLPTLGNHLNSLALHDDGFRRYNLPTHSFMSLGVVQVLWFLAWLRSFGTFSFQNQVLVAFPSCTVHQLRHALPHEDGLVTLFIIHELG